MFHPLFRELSSLVRIFITFPLLSDTLQLMAIERLTEALLLGPQPELASLNVVTWSRRNRWRRPGRTNGTASKSSKSSISVVVSCPDADPGSGSAAKEPSARGWRRETLTPSVQNLWKGLLSVSLDRRSSESVTYPSSRRELQS